MNKEKLIVIRLTEQDKKIITKKADSKRLSVSSYCRTILTQENE